MVLCKRSSPAAVAVLLFVLFSQGDAKLPHRNSSEEQVHLNRLDRVSTGNHRHSTFEVLRHETQRSRYTHRDVTSKRPEDISSSPTAVHLHATDQSPAKLAPERKHHNHDKKWLKTYGKKAWKIINSRTATKDSTKSREKRAVVNSGVIKNIRPTGWGHTEWLGDGGQVALQWRTTEGGIVFRVEARAEGHVGLSIENDAVLVWVNDQEEANIMDCHLVNGIPELDESHDYELVFGLRNHTHVVVEFRRPLNTCDHDDVVINSDAVNVQWTLGKGNPIANGWKGWQGSRTLRFLNPKAPIPGISHSNDYKQWDVVLKNYEIPEYVASLFWVKIFKVPTLDRKHHIVGYHPVSTSGTVRHAVLYECAVEAGAENGQWDHWAEANGTTILKMPQDWGLCITPVATWAIGSKGEMFPEHVGIPLAEPHGVTYYMLEVHCENFSLKKVVDNFGLTILYTDELRQHDAGVMVSGVTVSALHVLPADQPRYRSAGYCAEPCTSKMFPEDGINIVSVLLHAHSAKRKLSLRHIRNGEELPKIAEDEYDDNKIQQSRVLLEERNVLPGDELITECFYNTQGRSRPTLGGYSSKQEMCLAFILHYPRIPLAGCYSMTPVKEFFETFGVKEFYSFDMTHVENMFLTSGSLEGHEAVNVKSSDVIDESNQGDDQGVSVLGTLVIKEPFEFRNKTFIAHLNELPWDEPIFTKRIEDTLYKGKHMTFCRKRDESLAVPIEIRIFPNFSESTSTGSVIECLYKLHQKNSSTSSSNAVYLNSFSLILTMTLLILIYVKQ